MGMVACVGAALAGTAAFVACLSGGLWNVLSAVRPGPARGERAKRGAATLVAAAAIAVAPWIAAPIAEWSTGWVDADHNGFVDPMANGSYDWVDINGGAWAIASGAMVLAVLGTLALTSAATRGPRQPARR